MLCASKVSVLWEPNPGQAFWGGGLSGTYFVNFEWPEVWDWHQDAEVVYLGVQVLLWIWAVNSQVSEKLHGLWDVSALDFSFQAKRTINDWMGSAGKACPHTMTADESEAGELALEPLLTCKLCLCEYSLDKMTTLQECSCIFCTSVRPSSAFMLQSRVMGDRTVRWHCLSCTRSVCYPCW